LGKYRLDSESMLRDSAWIGDAVLSLYLRRLLIENEIEPVSVRTEMFKYFSSNAFLNSFGRPTAMEAEIGDVFYGDGLEAAFRFIEQKYLPVIKRQLTNRTFGEQRIALAGLETLSAN
jgi:hypothetical protein